MNWQEATDISQRLKKIIPKINFGHVQPDRVFCFRSLGSTGRATARIWSLPHLWQQALNETPAYCLEVISERFDKLTLRDQDKVLIHELLHIPKNFSGALAPHRNARHRTFRHYHDEVDRLYLMYIKN